MEDSRILELLKKKSPQTTLEVARAAGMSWHVVQEQLLEMQIDGKLDRINVGRQNLWFPKGAKLKGTVANSFLIGIVAVLAVLVSMNAVPQISVNTDVSELGDRILQPASVPLDIPETTPQLPEPMKSYEIGDRIKLDTPNDGGKTLLVDPHGNEKEIKYTIGGIDTNGFMPGIYTVKIVDGNETLSEMEFALGLVTINTRKSIYTTTEEAEIIVGVIDHLGSRVNNVLLYVNVTSSEGSVSNFYYDPISLNGTIKNNDDGTYTIKYNVTTIGIYGIDAFAYSDISNISANYTTTFEVRSGVDFVIERYAPTVTYLEGEAVRIYITPQKDADSVIVKEYVPAEWNITVYGNGTENNGTITWNLGNVKKDVRYIVRYDFDPPDVSPLLTFIGPAEINYTGGSFGEARKWTVGIDAAFFYYVKWVARWRDHDNVVDELTMCRGEYYNFSTVMFDLGQDTDSSSQTIRIQVLPQAGAVYQTLPSSGWTFWSGGNNRTVASELGNNAVDCQNGQIDHCYLTGWELNITNDTYTKGYKLKFTSVQNPG